jgi:hypothetical protein
VLGIVDLSEFLERPQKEDDDAVNQKFEIIAVKVLYEWVDI